MAYGKTMVFERRRRSGFGLVVVSAVWVSLAWVVAACGDAGEAAPSPEQLAVRDVERDLLAHLLALQRHLLGLAADLVRPGGRLVYVTCSLLDEEGAGQIADFVARQPGWHVDRPAVALGRARGPGVRLTPFHDGTDGFFIARLAKA